MAFTHYFINTRSRCSFYSKKKTFSVKKSFFVTHILTSYNTSCVVKEKKITGPIIYFIFFVYSAGVTIRNYRLRKIRNHPGWQNAPSNKKPSLKCDGPVSFRFGGPYYKDTQLHSVGGNCLKEKVFGVSFRCQVKKMRALALNHSTWKKV